MKFCVSTQIPENLNIDLFESPMQMPPWAKSGKEENINYIFFYIEEKSKVIFFSAALISRYFKFFTTLHLNYGPDFFQIKNYKIVEFYFKNILEWAQTNQVNALFIEPRNIKLKIKQLIDTLGFENTYKHINSSESLQLNLKNKSLDNLFASIDKNCRYNINYAIKNGVKIIKLEGKDLNSSDENFLKLLNIFYELLLTTKERKNFFIKSKKYYENFILNFAKTQSVVLWVAEYQNEIVAENISIYNKNIYTSIFSASKRLQKDIKATYLLKWEGIKDAALKNCVKYDFWGATTSTSASHPFYFTTKFKKQFGSNFIKYPNVYVYKFSKIKYMIWRLLILIGLSYFFEEESFRYFKYNK